MTNAILSTTDKARTNKVFRLKSKIQSRIDYFTGAFTHSEKNKDQEKIETLRQFCLKWQEYTIRLDQVYINYQQLKNKESKEYKDYLSIYREANNWSDRKTHLKELLNINQFPINEKNTTNQYILDYLSRSARDTNARVQEDRIKLELIDKYAKGWFIVFSTLTVDSQHYYEVFKQGSDCWRNYIRKIDRLVAKSEYGSYRKAQGKEYFKYFAVTELGEKTDRLHIHVLKFMKHNLDARCPNDGLDIPINREIKDYCYLWTYGNSTHIPIRWNGSDPWALKNFRWVAEYNKELKNYQPLKNSSIQAIQAYVMKYVTKSNLKKIKLESEVYAWKVKTSRTFGKTELMEIIAKLSKKELMVLASPRQYPIPIKMYDQKISSRLIRTLVVNQLTRIDPQLPTLPKDTTLKMLLKTGTNKSQDPRLPNSGDLLQKLLTNKVTFSFVEFLKIKRKIEKQCVKLSDATEYSGAGLKKAT